MWFLGSRIKYFKYFSAIFVRVSTTWSHSAAHSFIYSNEDDSPMPWIRRLTYRFLGLGKSIPTAEWKAHLYGYYEKHGGAEKIKALDSIDWNVGDNFFS